MLLKRILLLCLSVLLPVRGADWSVIVGGPGILQFNPSTVNAAPGDTVTFTFKQSNNTATQSTFANPCEMAVDGFDTGFIPVADDNTDGPFPAAEYTVEDATSVWVYCRQTDHCQQGMVFAINPGDQFPAFQAAAMGTTVPSSSAAASTSSATSSSSSHLSLFSAAEPPVTFSSVAQSSSETVASTSITSTDHINGTGSADAPANTMSSGTPRFSVGGSAGIAASVMVAFLSSFV